MKKILLIITALLAFNAVLKANPVDVAEAKTLGEKFAGHDLTLAYTANSARGEACFYVFNIGEEGFVILSADDFYRPIIGYSMNGKFDYDNIAPALRYYLDGIAEARGDSRSSKNAAAPDVAADWRMLETTGRLVSRHGGRDTDYLVKTQWNQSYPYNAFCPEDPQGDHGHAIVGCLATSMAQLISFWKYPEHGNGSHCYYHEDYGQICADFEHTYYDWDHIANKVTASSPIEEIEAAATISFHCGVTIDMGYGPDGSGGASAPIPGAIHDYFSYSDACIQLNRNDFETKTWKAMVREQFDMEWPMYYGGCADDGCHAFICDGYDDYDMFHFNLGWGGSSDGWYLIDEAPYTHPADAMFNFVPQVVYDATPSAPTDLTVTPKSDTSFEATLSWTNPTTYLDGSAMTDIEKVIIMRNSKVIKEITGGITAGATMTFTDHVPYYDRFEYKVFVQSNGRKGKQAINDDALYGPSCSWKIVMTTSNNNGWEGNHISLYNAANTEVYKMTMKSSMPQAIHIDVPVGRMKFSWVASDNVVGDISFNVYDSQNVSLYSFSGSSADMAEGVFLEVNNGCGNAGTCDAPYNFNAVADGENIVLEWRGWQSDVYAYCIYRDDALYKMVANNYHPFVDDATGGVGHCYAVSMLCENGESEMSRMMCVSVGEGCNPARNLWRTKQDDGNPLITWEAPENTNGLAGYFLYKKCGEDGEYERIKALGANKFEYKDLAQLELGKYYYYKLVACYQNPECYSIPAKARYGYDYFVRFLYDPDGIYESATQTVELYPNPAKDVLTIKADNLTNVVVYNSIGQKVLEKSLNANEVIINTDGLDSGIYIVKIVANGDEIIRKVAIQN